MRKRILKLYESANLSRPLNGKIVLGFCYYVAGPIALQNFVQQGALVIKVERKPQSDPAQKVFSSDIFNTLTHGQLSVAIDYTDKDAQKLINKIFKIAKEMDKQSDNYNGEKYIDK